MKHKRFVATLPNEEYRMLLGTGLCAFNQNHGVIVNNILEVDDGRYNWYDLINLTSGRISERAKKTIAQKCGGTNIPDLFDETIALRNNIVHSFQGVTEDSQPILRRKAHSGKVQFNIDEAYLNDFLAKNAELAKELKAFNKHHTKKSHRRKMQVNGEEC